MPENRMPASDLQHNKTGQSIPVLSREESYNSHNLTDREIQTAELLLQGLSNDEIKRQLLVSLSTVKLYVGEIFKKYDVKSRAEFIASFYNSRN